jgi:hypothetical protein
MIQRIRAAAAAKQRAGPMIAAASASVNQSPGVIAPYPEAPGA